MLDLRKNVRLRSLYLCFERGDQLLLQLLNGNRLTAEAATRRCRCRQPRGRRPHHCRVRLRLRPRLRPHLRLRRRGSL